MKKYIIITLVLVLIGVLWGININLQNKASIGVIGGADGPTAILVVENKDADIIVLDNEYNIDTVIALGKIVFQNKEIKVKGRYEK